MFERTMYSFNEDDGTVSVRLVLNRQVSQDLSVVVLGGMDCNKSHLISYD